MSAVKLVLHLPDKTALHNHYMPLVRGGGFFIPCQENLSFGDSVLVQIELPSEGQKAVVPGKVVWITPSGAVRNLPKGVGIQITGEHQLRIQQYFEGLLGDLLQQSPPRPAY
ncbi:PilZ domain-containing protein [Thiolinea disciformis]|uniref:PilZ domain-containing protein n=1 Tax=Thiolinea disciformis TaxID=125614 RepID=UPI00035E0FD1|nr:PilZ domain-containing protein [Thiolinea disciformis]